MKMDELQTKQHATDIYLESILFSSPNNIYWMDKEGRIIGCNDQQARYCGLNSRFDLIGKNIFDVGALLGWPPEISQKIRERDLLIMKDGTTSIEEETVVLNGQEHIFLASKSPMYDENNNIIGILGISVNITEQKRVESKLELAKQKAETSDRAKSEFVAQISHDIRTPLVGIQGVTQRLIEQAPRELQPELHALAQASSELLNLLNNVIHLTKADFAEKTMLKQEPFDLGILINNLVDLFTPAAQQKCLTLQVDYPKNIPHQFISTPLLIQRALLNLISNALKFTHHGHVSVKVKQDERAAQGSSCSLLIIVEDSGIGIAADQLSKIFTRFYRPEHSYQSQYHGSGLGLAIAEQFVQELKGKIWAESEIGKGARFFVSLCLPISDVTLATGSAVDDYAKTQATATQSLANSLSTTQSLPAASADRLSVLLVEDNFLIQQTVIYLLNQLNCQVTIAGDAATALGIVKFNKYDFILMDIGLPDHDGFWLAQQIRQLSTEVSKTPIIAVTAHLEEDKREQCLAAGMNDVFIKPISLEKLKRVLIKTN